jgi:hypothetical protein
MCLEKQNDLNLERIGGSRNLGGSDLDGVWFTLFAQLPVYNAIG